MTQNPCFLIKIILKRNFYALIIFLLYLRILAYILLKVNKLKTKSIKLGSYYGRTYAEGKNKFERWIPSPLLYIKVWLSENVME